MSLIVDTPSLQTAMVEWLARDQDATLIARVPTFIQLFEAKMNRTLFVRQMETRSQAVTASPISVLTTGATATTSAVLAFAAVPSSVVTGASAFDSTTAQQLGTVLSVTPTTVTLMANVLSAVSIGDSISFGPAEPQYVALPPDFQMMRRLSITMTVDSSGNTHHRKKSLEYISPTQLDEFKQERSIGGFDEDGGFDAGGGGFGGSGRHFYTIFGNEIELYPTPHSVTTLEMVYRQNLPPLSANSTNWLLTLAPDLYLYGSLLGSAPYIKEDGRIEVWGAGMMSAMNDLNSLSANLTFAAGPMQVRVDRGGGGSRSFAAGFGF